MKKGEIWITRYPFKGGREQSGKRPSIIIADTDANISIVIPITTNLNFINKFSNTILIKASEEKSSKKNGDPRTNLPRRNK
jgi:mRNA-degrading endonuclease toxin of MazEF toxin-antitoxin module